MALVKVYRYDYFDRLLKHDRRSVDYATADAIAAMGGTILAESMRETDDRIVDEDGFVRAADLWRAQMEPQELMRRARRGPGENRISG